jgi:type IV pilus assembly protein PilA
MSNLNPKQRTGESGFTLIELLIVVAILGLLAAIGIPQYQGYQAQARINATKALHTEMVKLIGAEMAKCTSGATNYLENAPAGVTLTNSGACSNTAAEVATDFIAYGNDKSENPYDAAVSPYDAATAANGKTLITATGNVITIATTWNGGSQTSTIFKE